MNRKFSEDSANKGEAFLKSNKKILHRLKNTVIPSTSSIHAGFIHHQPSTNPALIQQEPSTKLAIKHSLIEFIKGSTGTRRKLLIESKAAEIIKASLEGILAHNINSQTWHEFTGSHWKPLALPQLADRQLFELVREGADDLGFKPAYKNGIKSFITDGDMLPLPKMDYGELPFKNGLLDLKTKQLIPITHENAYTWCLPYAYQSDAVCPNIKAWLLDAVNEDKETVHFLHAWMAAILHRRHDLQKFLHLKGSGGTGKGVFMRLLTALVGKENTAFTSLDQLERNRFETAVLHNKMLALITDSDKYGGAINIFKAITGQDPIRLERKNLQQEASFVFEGLVMIASNESLQTTDHTSALDRRRITVIFDRRATPEEKLAWDIRGGEEVVLHSEIPGLVNWLLELSQEEISNTIRNPPVRIKEADLEAMMDNSPIAHWLIECTEADPDAWTQVGIAEEIKCPSSEKKFKDCDSRLYANYCQWCSYNQEKPISSRKFRTLVVETCKTLNRKVDSKKLGSGMGIIGIKLKT